MFWILIYIYLFDWIRVGNVYNVFIVSFVMVIHRIRARDLAVVVEKGKGWVKSKVKFDSALDVAKLFRKHGKLDLILDSKDARFLKGSLIDGNIRGERIGVLPDGGKLDKAFPLFALDLRVHDERSNVHWDVLFRNPSGSFCYLYSEFKIGKSKKAKYKRVDDFGKLLPRLKRNLMKNLDDEIALAILVLLETKIRVGSEVYYKRNHHKGLSTLKKKNLKIIGNEVVFDFVGKDGVPQRMVKKFPKGVVKELEKVLKGKKADDFVFLKGGRVLRDSDFEAAFERYCGTRFYPHIVRSHFATRKAERFLKKSKVSKDDVRDFYLGLAGELGHKKFSKKSGKWEENFEVTLHYYVRPDLVEAIGKMV